MVSPRRAALVFALMLLLVAPAMADPDPRKQVDQTSPMWLAAVGKLVIPATRIAAGRRQHYREDCSATLVAEPGSPRADIIVTAWHCLEFYRDLSKPIVFTLRYGEDRASAHQARRLEDGGGMHADWAILRLAQAISREDVAAVSLALEEPGLGGAVSMAGYSRDPGLGALGERLTYDDSCRLLARHALIAETDCRAHKGASGGAVVASSAGSRQRLLGIVSEGDGRALSTFVPTVVFRSRLNRYLAN